MHIVNASLESDSIKFTPRTIATAHFLVLLIDEQTNEGFLTGHSDATKSGSFVTITGDFSFLTNERPYYLRVFYNPTSGGIIADTIAGGYQKRPVGQHLTSINDAFGSNQLSEEVYRGKVFTTATTDLQDYSIYTASPFTQTAVNTAQKFITI